MKAFRVLLSFITISIIVYTGIVLLRHGGGAFSTFFGDMVSLTWPGQFNFDFMCYLTLSGLWLAWRHDFSFTGIILGVLVALTGSLTFVPYLLITTFLAKSDIKEFFLGNTRACG